MKLRYDYINHEMVIGEDEPTLLVIENPSLMDKYICDLNASIEKVVDSFHLLSNEKEMEISKKATIITSPLDLVFSARSFQKALFKELGDTMKELGYDQQRSEITSSYICLLEELNVSYEYNFDFETDISSADLLGLFKVHLCDPEGSFAEKLVDFVKITNGLTAKDLFVLFNCILYMKKDELEYMINETKQMNACILFVESREPEQLQYYIKKYIIDADVCEINNVENHLESQCCNGIYSEITI